MVFLVGFIPSKLQGQSQIVGEIRLFSFGFVPRGWIECNGQLLPTNQYTALFSVLGTTYGGDGISNFALPNLNGRTAIHPGGDSNISLGNRGGSETETMTIEQMPAHDHAVTAGVTLPASNQTATTATPGVYAVVATRGNAYNTTSDSNSASVPVTLSTTHR